MIVTCPGTISEASRTINRKSRPGKRRRAKAYPAIEQDISCPSVVKAAILKLFQKKSSNGAFDSNGLR